MRAIRRLCLAGIGAAVLAGSVFVGEARAGNIVSIYFKTPGDKYETHADSSTRAFNPDVYYYYTPSRPGDRFPVCVDPNGLRVTYRYQNNEVSTYYQLGGVLHLWHGRMEVNLIRIHPGSYTYPQYSTDDEGELYLNDMPDGNYVILGSALLLGAYLDTTDGHRSWFSAGTSSNIDGVYYWNVMSFLGSKTNAYQAHTWYEMLPPTGFNPYASGIEFFGGYVPIDLRISSISSQHVSRIY